MQILLKILASSLLINWSLTEKTLAQNSFDTLYLFKIDTLGFKERQIWDEEYDFYPIAVEIAGNFAVILNQVLPSRNFRLINCPAPIKIMARVTDETNEGYRRRRKKMKYWYDSEVVIDAQALGTNRIWLKPEWQGDSLVVRPVPLPKHRKHAMRRTRKSWTEWEYNCQTGKPQLLNRKGQPQIIYNPPKTLDEAFPEPRFK